MDKKYDLWWYSKNNEEWLNLKENGFDSYEEVFKRLKTNTNMTLEFCIKGSLFKIAEHGDKSWMKHIPSYLLNK